MQHVTAAVRVLLPVTCLVWVVFESRRYRHRRADATRADRGSRSVLRVVAVIGFLVAVVSAKAVPGAAIHPEAAAAWCGLVLLWCGIALRVWSIRTLGGYFTYTVQTSARQPVIASGPYRMVRHPSYTGLLLAIAGIGLIYANWLSLLALVVAVFAGLAYRIAVEEDALLDALGDSYRAYAATRKRLIPFLW